MGCILAELLQMMPENCSNPKGREILLKGDSDFVLSPYYRNPKNAPKSQLKVIFDLLGKPDQNFIDAIDNAESKEFAQNYDQNEASDMTGIFPYGPPEALDLLQSLLTYEPRDRCTVEEALYHPWLECVEGLDDHELNQDHEPVMFDFEDIPLSRFTIRLLVIDEIAYYNDWVSNNESVLDMRKVEKSPIVPIDIAPANYTQMGEN